MKKFALAAVAAASMAAGVAQAYTVGTYTNGVVVPNVIHNGAANTTAVGLINRSGGTVPVFWTFFDQNSGHKADGCFGMTQNQYRGFNWAEGSGLALENVRGYLVFSLGTNVSPTVLTVDTVCKAPGADTPRATSGGALSANAFFVDLAGRTVAYTPVIDGPLAYAAGANLSTLGEDSLLSAAGAATFAAGSSAPTFTMRYFMDNQAGGNDTRITVWSTGDQRGTHTVNMFDNAQNRRSVNFVLAESELAWFDPETIPGRPAAFLDGFLEWNLNVPASSLPTGVTQADTLRLTGGSVMTYSTIIAPAFGAVQTLLGAHQ